MALKCTFWGAVQAEAPGGPSVTRLSVLSDCFADGASTDDGVAVVEDDGLAGGDGAFRLVEADEDAAGGVAVFIAEDFGGGRNLLRLVAGFYGNSNRFRRLIKRDPVEVVGDEGAAVEGLAGGEDNFVLLHVLATDVHRGREGEAESLSRPMV